MTTPIVSPLNCHRFRCSSSASIITEINWTQREARLQHTQNFKAKGDWKSAPNRSIESLDWIVPFLRSICDITGLHRFRRSHTNYTRRLEKKPQIWRHTAYMLVLDLDGVAQ
jgi:hypothetical protein